MPALVRLGTMQQCVLVFVLVAAVVGVSIVVVVVMCGFDLGGPGVVFGGLGVAGQVVRVGGFGGVGQGAFAEELVQVVARDAGCDGEEEAGGG
jgi:hypothetical protein